MTHPSDPPPPPAAPERFLLEWSPLILIVWVEIDEILCVRHKKNKNKTTNSAKIMIYQCGKTVRRSFYGTNPVSQIVWLKFHKYGTIQLEICLLCWQLYLGKSLPVTPNIKENKVWEIFCWCSQILFFHLEILFDSAGVAQGNSRPILALWTRQIELPDVRT